MQIIPQSVCSRHGLAIGATVAPFVRVLVWICFPVAYPISKVYVSSYVFSVLLDYSGDAFEVSYHFMAIYVIMLIAC